MKKIRYLSIIIILLLAGCGRQPYSQTEICMGTYVTIKAMPQKDVDTEGAIRDAFGEIRRVDELMSMFRKDSDVSRINSSDNWVGVDKLTFYVIKMAKEFSEMSGGGFDITVKPLVDLWGFGTKEKRNTVPDKEALGKAISLVGYQNILLDEERLRVKLLKKGMAIDLSGIAKGFAADRAVETLRNAGIKNGLVDLGGDIYCFGNGPRSKGGWIVGIRHPREKNKLIGRIKLKDKAIATSGDYENFFIVDNKRYSHIINPRTGYPIENNPMSVSVIANDCITAQALTKSIFVFGPKEGMKFINSLSDIDGIIISQGEKNLSIEVSKNLKASGKLSINDKIQNPK